MPFQGELTVRITEFIERIGIPVRAGEVPDDAFLPGILVDRGALVVDEAKLKYPGDLLHEAGHIAVTPAVERDTLFNNVNDHGQGPGEEMAAVAWSWAALKHLELPPEVVFHPNGYKGDAEWLIEHFSAGSDLGVPLLQWMGLCAERHKAREVGMAPFPTMTRWLRE